MTTTSPGNASAHLCAGAGIWDLVIAAPPAWHADLDPHASAVLSAHHPTLPLYADIKHLPDDALQPGVSVITAGFPCQPVSVAGARKGDQDERWLWPTVLDITTTVRPRYLVLENVAGIKPYVPQIAADLNAAGYSFRHVVTGACEVGARHHRHRWFGVAELSDDPTTEAVSRKGWCRRIENSVPTPLARVGMRGIPSMAATLRRRERRGGLGMMLEEWVSLNAPEHIVTGPLGGRAVSATWIEELMMYPAGHVTDHIGLRPALVLLGNGMVPAQARHALHLLGHGHLTEPDTAGEQPLL